MTTPPSSTGSLKGQPPKEFSGNWSKSLQFLREFHHRVSLALSYIRGPKVDDWGDKVSKELDDSVTTHVLKLDEKDEVLWSSFEKAFKDAWTDTLSEQNALQKLTTLTMVGDDIDSYITTFDQLSIAAGWDPDANGTIEFFKRGMKKGLLVACLRRPMMPKKMSEWRDAAREEAQRYQAISNAIANLSRGKTDTQKLGPTKSTQVPRPRNDQVVPMDVDNIQTSQNVTITCHAIDSVLGFPRFSFPSDFSDSTLAITKESAKLAVMNMSSAERQEFISALLLDTGDDDILAINQINVMKSVTSSSITVTADVAGTNQKLLVLLDTGASGNFIDRGAAWLLGFANFTITRIVRQG
ncbi:hypothetical protein EDB86DRAFT_3075046 [Lactarius hatsudake]|nr:hypothetical protein EDB86DRAFT_3075046 [Lactarius hatsudake]